MLVNYIQIAYVLGVSSNEAKLKMAAHLYKCRKALADNSCISMKEVVKLINKDDKVESSLLNEFFRHPSPMLDGKDKIEYIINYLRNGNGIKALTKKLAEDTSCLKSGKISGKYIALRTILSEENIKYVNEVLRRKHEEYVARY